MRKSIIRVFSLALTLPWLAACPGSGTSYTAYGLTSTGQIVTFSTGSPASLSSTVSVTGLPTGHYPVQIKFSPVSQTLYCVTSAAELCQLDPATGAATLVSGSAFDAGVLPDVVAAVDPLLDEMRVINLENNLRVNLQGGLAATATPVAFNASDVHSGTTPDLVGLAYESVSSGAGRTLFALDVSTQGIVQVGNPGDNAGEDSADTGALYTIGSVGIPFGVNAGFDIDTVNGNAFAALAGNGAPSALYGINLSDGSATLVDTIGDGTLTIISLALAPG